MTLDPKLKAIDQPDIHSIHVEFLRPGAASECTIKVQTLKIGPLSSTLQLHLIQDDKVRALAVVTTTNFDKDVGPSASAGWTLNPPAQPKPNFQLMRAGKQDANGYLPILSDNGFAPQLATYLYSHTADVRHPKNIYEAWMAKKTGDFFDNLAVMLLPDSVPAMHDGVMQEGAPYDLANFMKNARAAYEANEGPAVVKTTMKQLMKIRYSHYHLSMSYIFKKRMPATGLEWILVRSHTKGLDKGRMEVDLEMLDENMDLLCVNRQNIIVNDMARKFKKQKASL